MHERSEGSNHPRDKKFYFSPEVYIIFFALAGEKVTFSPASTISSAKNVVCTSGLDKRFCPRPIVALAYARASNFVLGLK